MKVAIIGTAGRKGDAQRMSARLYDSMYNDMLENLLHLTDEVDLVSGGAAWADHLAVQLWLNRRNISLSIKSLTLYLPCRWYSDSRQPKFVGNTEISDTANYYHAIFSQELKYGDVFFSRKQIQRAFETGADCNENLNGFKARNLQVGDVDAIIAYTWGVNKHVPDDGGTLHTWQNSRAKIGIHRPLTELA